MRQDTGGTWAITVNYTAETAKQWQDAIQAYNTAKQSNLNMWFEVVVPNVSDAFFVIAEMPQSIPMPELAQNELMTVEINLSIVEYKGTSTAVAFS